MTSVRQHVFRGELVSAVIAPVPIDCKLSDRLDTATAWTLDVDDDRHEGVDASDRYQCTVLE